MRVKTRNVFFALLGVAGLVLKGHYFDNVTFTDLADCVAGTCVNAFGYPGD
jgi:hypothetical protein